MDIFTKEKRSEIMSKIRSKDMKPEMLVRKITHSMGYRYRLHRKDLPGKPDLVFPSRKKVIFVHGCFWHQHQKKNCPISHKPKSNLNYWKPKLERTIARDKKHKRELRKNGWKVLVIWECELKNIQKTAKKVKQFLE